MIPAREPQENVRSEDDTVVQQRVRYFGDYERLNEIARGGMGVVHTARQINWENFSIAC